jgi:diamine N-acetyltransferase
MGLRIREVTEENWKAVALLSVEENQEEYIESNSFSIAQSLFETHWNSVGLYDHQTLVGYAMYGQEEKSGEVWLDRFMIDKNYQGKGYAKQFLSILMEHIHQKYQCNKIYLSISPDNAVAQNLYEQFGFRLNGDIDRTGVIVGLTMVAEIANKAM